MNRYRLNGSNLPFSTNTSTSGKLINPLFLGSRVLGFIKVYMYENVLGISERSYLITFLIKILRSIPYHYKIPLWIRNVNARSESFFPENAFRKCLKFQIRFEKTWTHNQIDFVCTVYMQHELIMTTIVYFLCVSPVFSASEFLGTRPNSFD